MAYNLIAETPADFDWLALHEVVNNLVTQALEVFPIAVEQGDSPGFVGICIPTSKMDAEPDFWTTFLSFHHACTRQLDLRLFDLYNGIYVEETSLPKVRAGLLG